MIKHISLKKLDNKNISKQYMKFINDKKINMFTESRFTHLSLKKLSKFIKTCNKDKNVILRGIFYKNKHIGNVKLNINSHHLFAYVGIIISKDYENKGIGETTIKKIIKIAKNNKLNKLIAGIYANNKASIKLFSKTNFAHSGVFKKHYKFKNTYVDKIQMEYLL